MVTYHLDTNTCIYALKGRYPAIERRIRRLSPERIKIPALVKAELLLGAEKSQSAKRTREAVEAFLLPFAVVAFGDAAAIAYARIRAELERAGQPIGPNDLIIAATVLAAGGVLVTHDAREFGRVKALKLQDWTV